MTTLLRNATRVVTRAMLLGDKFECCTMGYRAAAGFHGLA
jgi:hypothetical protein